MNCEALPLNSREVESDLKISSLIGAADEKLSTVLGIAAHLIDANATQIRDRVAFTIGRIRNGFPEFFHT
jgi:hypothetical protein